MAKILIKDGRLIDAAQKLDGDFDLLLADGRVAEIAPRGKIRAAEARVIDAKGLIVAPGFIDLHCHLREPGFEYKETIQTGTAAAVAGGFTAVCCMANTEPVNDNASVTDYILKQAADVGACRVYPIGAITKGLKGRELAPVGELKGAGCVAISDDGLTVQDAQLMRLAMEYAKSFDLPVATHSMEAMLSEGGQMNESLTSTRLGLRGMPNAAEDVIIARDIMLAELTGAHLHVGHLSTREGVRLVAEAKKRGIRVTCEVTPHHLTLTDESVAGYDTNFKVCPPLRGVQDVAALKEALKAGGIVDAIATDHAPHGVIDKEVEFDKAAFGIIGLETALPLALGLVREGCLDLIDVVGLLTCRPAAVFKLPGGSLKKGAVADVVLFDPEREWVVQKESIVSKSKNTPFLGQTFKGRVVKTIVGGIIKFEL